jgi:hypothetical protein
MTTASAYVAAIYESVKAVKVATADPYYNMGYVIGAILFFVVLVLIYKFAGRWGWFGVLIRMACAGLVAFRVFALLFAHAPAS